MHPCRPGTLPVQLRNLPGRSCALWGGPRHGSEAHGCFLHEQASSLANKLATPSPTRPHIPFLGAAGTPAPSMASDDAIPLDDALSDARRAIDLFLDGETEESRKIVEPL